MGRDAEEGRSGEKIRSPRGQRRGSGRGPSPREEWRGAVGKEGEEWREVRRREERGVARGEERPEGQYRQEGGVGRGQWAKRAAVRPGEDGGRSAER